MDRPTTAIAAAAAAADDDDGGTIMRLSGKILFGGSGPTFQKAFQGTRRWLAGLRLALYLIIRWGLMQLGCGVSTVRVLMIP